MERRTLRGYIYVIMSAIIFGCMPLGVKLIYAEGVPPLTVVLLRNLLPLPILAVLAKAGGGTLRPPKKKRGPLLLLALLSGCLTPMLLFSSYQTISSGTATVFHFIYPAATLLGGILVLKRKVQYGALLCVLLCTVGITLFYDPTDPLDLRGSMFALLSGLTYASYILMLSKIQDEELSGFRLNFFICLFTSGFLLALGMLTRQLIFPHSLRGWALAAAVSCVISVGAVVLFQQGTFLIGGEKAAILSTFEPITSLFVGFFAFQEAVGPRTLVGSLLVILAAILIAAFDLRAAKAALRGNAG